MCLSSTVVGRPSAGWVLRSVINLRYWRGNFPSICDYKAPSLEIECISPLSDRDRPTDSILYLLGQICWPDTAGLQHSLDSVETHLASQCAKIDTTVCMFLVLCSTHSVLSVRSSALERSGTPSCTPPPSSSWALFAFPRSRKYCVDNRPTLLPFARILKSHYANTLLAS